MSSPPQMAKEGWPEKRTGRGKIWMLFDFISNIYIYDYYLILSQIYIYDYYRCTAMIANCKTNVIACPTFHHIIQKTKRRWNNIDFRNKEKCGVFDCRGKSIWWKEIAWLFVGSEGGDPLRWQLGEWKWLKILRLAIEEILDTPVEYSFKLRKIILLNWDWVRSELERIWIRRTSIGKSPKGRRLM